MNDITKYVGKYLETRSKYRSTKIITVWVENEEDVPFWYSFFSELISDVKLNISAPSTGEKGKKSIRKYFGQEGKHFLLCVDSDYDYILQTDIAKQIQNSPYLFQTYCYAIENFRCIPRNLEKITVQATLKTDFDFDFRYFLEEYSTIIYPLFLQFLENQNIELPIFKKLKLESDNTISFSNLENDVKFELAKNENILTKEFNIPSEETYLYLRGHDLEALILWILKELCGRITGLKKQEIANTSTNKKNDIAMYQNKIRDVEHVILDNDVYIFQKKNFFEGKAKEFIDKIKEDILFYKQKLNEK